MTPEGRKLLVKRCQNAAQKTVKDSPSAQSVPVTEKSTPMIVKVNPDAQ